MNCLRCELARARLIAAARVLLGWHLERIADHLSTKYGERYYVEDAVLYRASKMPPYKPHIIMDAS